MITYHPPTLPYKGLTIILDHPSRFDTKQLITGNAGNYFNDLLSPLTRFQCDIRLASDTRPMLPNTKTVLLLGQGSLDLLKPESGLLTYRGSPFRGPRLHDISSPGNAITYIPTVTPQDAFDRIDYESETADGSEETENDSDAGKEKDYQKTRRKNYKFWLYADVKKAVRISQSGVRSYPVIDTKCCLSAGEIVGRLSTYKEGYLTIDIECDPLQQLTCFSILYAPHLNLATIADNQLEVLTIPYKRHDGHSLFYGNLDYARIFRELTLAMQRNVTVGHNLSFDLFIFLSKYHFHLPLEVYDTMVAHHRLFPEVEKSLGHCISYYTDLPYHKDEGVFDPKNAAQEHANWSYNAKDVITTYYIACLQQEYIKAASASDSVKQANKSMRSLLIMQLEGCLADMEYMAKFISDIDAKLLQLERILKLLTKRNFNPRSPKQVSHYLYTELGFPKPLKKPTDKENLFKLYAKHPIPSLRVILAYRVESKKASSLRGVRMWGAKGDRFTCNYSPTGTDTFRLNSKELLGFNI